MSHIKSNEKEVPSNVSGCQKNSFFTGHILKPIYIRLWNSFPLHLIKEN